MTLRNRSLLNTIAFLSVLLGAIIYTILHVREDLIGSTHSSSLAFLLLGLALIIALGFEFVNGFHDTANAVATVIYSNSLPPTFAVIWSGIWNFIGVLLSSGAVAYTIISLLPIELVLKVGSEAGFSMIFALLLAAVIWNLLTWFFGIPNSSSHTLIGSILGVGLMNQLLMGDSVASGVDWGQALQVFKALIFSPLAGFVIALLCMNLMRVLLPIPTLYQAPKDGKAPPWPMRLLLILTCTGVSFSHGSNDGQKGMGLIMLILIGTVPTAYALNNAVSSKQVEEFTHQAIVVDKILANYGSDTVLSLEDSRAILTKTIQKNHLLPDTIPAMRTMLKLIQVDVGNKTTFREVPVENQTNLRNNLYLLDQNLIHFTHLQADLPKEQEKIIENFESDIVTAIQFIPPWVKVVVAIALGLGTMVGWKRIVVTVGKKIGKHEMSYGQGAVAETVAMTMIQMGNEFHMPISTTHVVTSAIAGTSVGRGNGIQWKTIRNMAMAWVLTLPMSIILSGCLFWLFLKFF
ncbi:MULTISPECIES: inorganic phosphate transporter [Commensalibacter]|uniref:Phosphate transporter n=2 Tax=Commensalibacter TaxID=1079922 RepID=W7DW28_9PROT|nr:MULTISPECIES: inorganic phosphate transporter [Commensalibacter]EUK18418.1 low-affinity inorganic phosphate transporter [Commensalibacter papalotli (ex Servin-Garciduenas et al. 2014)]CAI3934035.1 Phosphate/sulfate permease (PitA) (PUBMED:31358606) [Commensalibacter papalotli (ex Botero et al. 2024)]CAI3941659.1 Phosphate/sulfate permease (PitA) (PUBMED:31358606) [Commensalibacter papalotli (ex Botero et al. 2024)]